MQTFLPDSDFTISASILDYRRLGKQRVEAYQILKGDWPNHPASKMWKNYRAALATYGIAICREWIKRGYKDTMLDRFLKMEKELGEIILPSWIGGPIHTNHRARLLAKNFDFYSKYKWAEIPTEVNYWPV
jgi:hypothetical protein